MVVVMLPSVPRRLVLLVLLLGLTVQDCRDWITLRDGTVTLEVGANHRKVESSDSRRGQCIR